MTELLLDALASWRLTRLIQRDEITEKPRTALIAWTLDNDHPQLRYLISCPHCLSVHASLFILIARRTRLGRGLRNLLAVAGLVSIWAEVENKATKT